MLAARLPLPRQSRPARTRSPARRANPTRRSPSAGGIISGSGRRGERAFLPSIVECAVASFVARIRVPVIGGADASAAPTRPDEPVARVPADQDVDVVLGEEAGILLVAIEARGARVERRLHILPEAVAERARLERDEGVGAV